MKKMYQGMLVSAEIANKELRAILRTTPESEWEDTLRGLVIEADENPMYYEASEDEATADMAFNNLFSVDVTGHGVTHVACTVLEKFTADDDGEWVDGSDYDYSLCMDEEEKEKLRGML